MIAGATVADAIKTSKAFETELQETWDQKVKSTSKEIIVPKGVSISKVNLREWSCNDVTKCLGVYIQRNGETDLTWETTKADAWKIYYKIARNADASTMSARNKKKNWIFMSCPS